MYLPLSNLKVCNEVLVFVGLDGCEIGRVEKIYSFKTFFVIFCVSLLLNLSLISIFACISVFRTKYLSLCQKIIQTSCTTTSNTHLNPLCQCCSFWFILFFFLTSRIRYSTGIQFFFTLRHIGSFSCKEWYSYWYPCKPVS